MLEVRAKVEIRAAQDRTSPGRIVGTLIQMGRVADDRAEVFAPGSIEWPHNGVQLLAEHRGRSVMRFQPVLSGSELRIDAPLPDTALGREVATEIRSGRRSDLSIEFHATDEAQVAGVREIRAALVAAAATVPTGSYAQAHAEVREKKPRRRWLYL